jgi:Asp-tRNA(Asn)/Glu-tRNA(Gln) amidotransferase A subunit family amidase
MLTQKPRMEFMTQQSGTIHRIRRALANGKTRPVELAELALKNSNQNAGRNVYLWQDAAWTKEESMHAEKMPRGRDETFGDGRGALWGLPISVKDCFDLAGAPTTCGTTFYRDRNGIAERDSWLVEQLRAAGAVITGKTHLHALAYGITGENPEFGDCIQPGTKDSLTGGSSSGAAASVMEGSAVAAIGTDTGGSVRVPAALCGLAGYRSSLGRGDWRGAAHLAESFDTLGWLFRDLQDAPLLAAPFAQKTGSTAVEFSRFAYVSGEFLQDCEREVAVSFQTAIRELEELGLEGRAIDATWWADSTEIFAPLQAAEAARLHAGNFEHFEQPIRERLEWGASLSAEEVSELRRRHAEFRGRMDELFAADELVMLPCAPVARLSAGAGDGGVAVRRRLLRYTAPFSLAGVPCIAIPCTAGGVQLAAARENDEALLELAARIGTQRNADAHRSEFQRFWQSIGD